MRTIQLEVPTGFADATIYRVAASGEINRTMAIRAEHPARPGVVIRRLITPPVGADLQEFTVGRVLPDCLPVIWNQIVTALWVSDGEAYEDVETYENTPVGIGEIRAFKTSNAANWKPRDVLVELLRRIDSGEYSGLDVLVVSFRTKSKTGATNSFYSTSSPDLHATLGVLMRATHCIQYQAGTGE
jgi:hypothetical protein